MTYAIVIVLLTLSGTQVASIRLGPEFERAEDCRAYHDGRTVAWTREVAQVLTYACEPSEANPNATGASG